LNCDIESCSCFYGRITNLKGEKTMRKLTGLVMFLAVSMVLGGFTRVATADEVWLGFDNTTLTLRGYDVSGGGQLFSPVFPR
jgi:hypothetical protein